jgi:hypothetical protein
MVTVRRLAALTAAAAATTTVAVVATSSTDATVPSAPGGFTAKRTVVLKWSPVPSSAAYRVWVDGVVVKTVTGTTASVRLPCGHRSRVNVQARNAVGVSAMKPPRYMTVC